MRRLISLLALAFVLPSLARAEEPRPVPRWWIQVEGGASYLSDRSFDLVASTDPVGVGDVRFGFVPGWYHDRIELDLGYAGGSLGGEALGTFKTNFEIHSLQLGVRYRQPIASFFSVYGRVAGLVDFNGLHLSDADANVRLSQWATTGGLLFNAGAELDAFTWRGGAVGFLLEFGYALRFNQARFDKISVDDTAKESVAFSPVNVGSLNVSGIQWRLGAVVHF
jgi:hypothetical protein